MQLNTRHATANIMPAVARMEKITVTGIATVTSCSNGTPSYGITPPGMRENGREGGMTVSTHLANNTHFTLNQIDSYMGNITGFIKSLHKTAPSAG